MTPLDYLVCYLLMCGITGPVWFSILCLAVHIAEKRARREAWREASLHWLQGRRSERAEVDYPEMWETRPTGEWVKINPTRARV
jgi:hypothetical protein